MKNLTIVAIIAGAMILAIHGLTGTTPANAKMYEYSDQACMAEAAGFSLNCSAKDIKVGEVINIRQTDGSPGPVECTAGQPVTFMADIRVVTTASERYDYTIYLPEGNWSPQEFNTANECSVLVGRDTELPGEDLESAEDLSIDPPRPDDTCADISKPPGEHLYTNQLITIPYCQDTTGDNRAEFNYCAAWNNSKDTVPVCTYDNPDTAAAPGTPSKCSCGIIDIDVFIKPTPPVISKSAGTPTTRPEPGGEYTFTVSFTNSSTTSSLFITGITDIIDTGADGIYETSLNLWGTVTDPVPAADGIYLVESTCPSGAPYELAPSTKYECSFTVHIVDTDLPDDQSPELYADLIKVALQDKNGDPVGDGSTCPSTGLSPAAGSGDNCSAIRQVDVTNLPPSITVTKTPSVDEVLEPGGNVTFNVVVTSTSGSYDDPLTLTTLLDDVFGDLNGQGTCATGGELSLIAPYTCSFTKKIEGNAGFVHTDTVTATATDNDGDDAQASDAATVNVNDVPSSITLEKTANPIEVDETGNDLTAFRDVDYTFEFSVNAAGVDDVTFSSLTDNRFDILTGDCMVTMKNGEPIASTPLNGLTLSPGENASCVIRKGLQGDAGDVHTNTATISGTDEDGQAVTDSDDATVTFLDTGLEIAQEFAMKATAFVRLTNGSVDTATISAITFKGINLVAGAGITGQFEILNEAADSHYLGSDSYTFCAPGATIAPQARYDCAFTLKLYPGFEAGNINLLASGVDGLVFTLTDDEGNPVTGDVDISIQTQE